MGVDVTNEGKYKLLSDVMLDYDELLYSAMKDRDCAKKEFNYRKIKEGPLPESHILKITPIKDQGKLGSCTAFAACGCLETLVLQSKKKTMNLSEQFCYSVTKQKDPWRGVWYSGTSTATASQVIRDYGVCHENLCVYKHKEFIKPKQYMLEDAESRKCVEIHYLDKSIDDIRQALYQGMPILCAIRMFQGFKKSQLKEGRVIRLGHVKNSGHAIQVFGYDSKHFYIKNSWGEDYADKGVVKIPKQMFMTVLKTVIAIEGLNEPFNMTVPKIVNYKTKKKPWWRFWW